MKKPETKKIKYLKQKQINKIKQEKRCANRIKNFEYQKKISPLYFHADFYRLEIARSRFVKNFYKSVEFNNSPIEIKIDSEFGLEKKENIDFFLDKSEKIIDFKSKSLGLNIEECSRVWPSGVVLLCSLKKWVELCKPKNTPSIYSTDSNYEDVNNYLNHCGFYDFVSREPFVRKNQFSDNEIVKIQREYHRDNIPRRHDDIYGLIENYSDFSNDQMDHFNCTVLTEVLNNVSEHGISRIDRGWWLLAQYHQKHKIISLCIADNGIGIRHSLMTGPQEKDIKIPNNSSFDGEFLKLAFEEKISGAIEASLQEKNFFSSKYPKGSSRGNGLKRIRSACSECKVPWSISSHFGYIFFEENGNIVNNGSRRNRIFAGTMYRFTIPTK